MTSIYLLRFPLLIAIAVVGFYLAAFHTGARSILANVFDISWPWGVCLLSFTALLTSWTVMITWRLILLYGHERYGTKRLNNPNIKWWQILLSSAISLPLIYGAISYSTPYWLGEALEAALGAFLALLCLLIAALAHKLFTRPEVAQKRPTTVDISELAHTSPDMFLPLQGKLVRRLRPVKRLIEWVERADKPSKFLQKLLELALGLLCRVPIVRRLCRVPENIGRGYFKYNNGEIVSILPGHGAAVVLLILSVTLFSLVGVYAFLRLGEAPIFPPLAYLLLLLTWLCWGLSGLAFFLDRFRIPVIIPLFLLFFLTSLPSWSDHYFPVIDASGVPREEQQAAAQPPTPAEANPTSSDETIIVVAASGGGIHAAAWATHVLTGLEEEFGDDFGKSIRLVSSVSGGSTGAMYFVNEYSQAGPPPKDELDKIVERVEGSSLDEVGWGIFYSDFLRLITSYGSSWDRGRTLEEAWLRNDLEWKNRSGIEAGLSEWQEGVVAGWRPGMIFNTTISDTGERLPLSTVDLPEGSAGRESQDELLSTSLGPKDISVVTAARLSAAFPFVSPAARANHGREEAVHVVDGGYYDNYGISSLVEWLDAELDKGVVKNVLVLQIRDKPTEACIAPEDQPTAPAEANNDKSETTTPAEQPLSPADPSNGERESARGWFYQLFAPLGTLLDVRSTGQFSHNEIELKLLKDKWEEKEQQERIEITPVVFGYDGPKPPLSWHLTEEQKEALREDWREELNGTKAEQQECTKSSVDTVNEFLGQTQSSQ